MNDRVRIFPSAGINVGTAPAASYDSGSLSNSGLNVGATFGHFTLEYRADTVDPTRAVLNLTVGTLTTGDVLMASGSLLSNFEIAIRSFDNSINSVNAGGTDFDNFTITQIPEPGTVALVSVGILGLLGYRRFRRV